MASQAEASTDSIQLQKRHNQTETDRALEEGPEDDAKLVTWDGPNDPENPKNWPMRKKWATTILISSFNFISPVASSMMAPVLKNIAADFKIQDAILQEMALSSFILAYAFGPLLVGPLSEIYGRPIVLLVTNAVYIVFNIASGVSRSTGQMIAFRFISGFGGGAPMAVGGGVLSDCFRSEERGKSMAIYSLAPLLGPAVGPIAGGFIAENTSWRWAFYSTSIIGGVIEIVSFFFLSESYGPKILQDRAKRLRKETGDQAYQTTEERENKTLARVLSTAMVRPFRLLATQPIVQVLAIYMGCVYGIMYLTLATFPDLWTSKEYYNESPGIGGLNYLSTAIGLILGIQLGAPLQDRIYRRLKKNNNDVGTPEFRVPLLIVVAIATPTGLFIYGWTAQTHCHWVAPNIGVALFHVGFVVAYLCIQTYIVDSYTRFAASALAACSFLRSLGGFAFPLFAPYMFKALGYGWGNSILAFVAIGIGGLAPVVLWHFGLRLRRASPYAAG